MGMFLKFFGPRAFKAVAGAVVTGGSTFAASCDIESGLTQLLTVGAATAAGYLAPYLTPNKPD